MIVGIPAMAPGGLDAAMPALTAESGYWTAVGIAAVWFVVVGGATAFIGLRAPRVPLVSDLLRAVAIVGLAVGIGQLSFIVPSLTMSQALAAAGYNGLGAPAMGAIVAWSPLTLGIGVVALVGFALAYRKAQAIQREARERAYVRDPYAPR